MLAGLMISTGAIVSRGSDLRPDRTDNLQGLVAAQADHNRDLREAAAELRDEISELAQEQDPDPRIEAELDAAGLAASTTAVTGPGIRVVLTDAPADVKPPGVSDDDLIVHQQDIQAVTNALWQGGAEAMSIQGQRVISTTGIKCVGNSVVLHGVPYAPPYVVEAIGNQEQLAAALEESHAVTIYRQYVAAYGLGYAADPVARLELPAFAGATGISLAQPTS